MRKLLFLAIFTMLMMSCDKAEVIVVGHINKHNYKEYIGKTVKVTGDVYLFDLGLTKLPINFTEVYGNFDCSHNQLTSLEGAPEKVGKSFVCSHNQLTSLEGAPEKVGGYFLCNNNKLTSLKGGPTKVGGIFYCSGNPFICSGNPFICSGNPFK